MKIYEIVNYYSQGEGLEARDVILRYLSKELAESEFYLLAIKVRPDVADWEKGYTSVEATPTGGLDSDYYCLEEHEIND